MNIYLAARYSRRREMQAVAAELVALGHGVTSRWIHGDHAIPAGTDAETADRLREQYALEDYTDLMDADCCIAFTEPPRTHLGRGGRHVEFGAALAHGLLVVVVGPRENVFHSLPGVEQFDTWAACRDWLQERVRPQDTDVPLGLGAAAAERW